MKTLFIDFDRTICFDRFWRNAPDDINQKIQKYLFIDNKDIALDWMKGKYTSEDINKIVAKNTGTEYQYILDVFIDDCKNMRVDKKILKLIKKLHSKYHVILITDNMDCLDRFTVPSLSLNKYFHKIVNSYNENVLKNNNNGQQFLNYVVGNIEDAVLIDDSNDSREVFEKLGGKSYKTTCEKDTLKILEIL